MFCVIAKIYICNHQSVEIDFGALQIVMGVDGVTIYINTYTLLSCVKKEQL